MYVSLNLHFKGQGFNAIKYNFRAKVSEKSFNKNRAKFFFKKFAPSFTEEKQAVKFLAANFILGKTWIGEFKKIEFPVVNFAEECKKYGKTYKDIKNLVENIMNSQDYDAMSFFILYDYATKLKTFEKLAEEFDENILFTEFSQKHLTLAPIYIYCLGLTESNRQEYLKILLNKD